MLDGIVERVHHEYFLQASIEDAFVHLVDTEAAGGRGSVEATIVFVDVESFTQLAESEGNQVAMETMNRVDSIVREAALEHHGKVVKNIGDALMLVFRRAVDAVAFADVLVASNDHRRGGADGAHRGVADMLDDRGAVEPLAVRMLRGAAQPVQLYCLTRREERRDPVCDRLVESPPVARLRHGDDELWFCTEECLRVFLSSTTAEAGAPAGEGSS